MNVYDDKKHQETIDEYVTECRIFMNILSFYEGLD